MSAEVVAELPTYCLMAMCRGFCLRRSMKFLKFLDDILYFWGAALVVTGLGMFSVPAAWIVAGLFLMLAGYLYDLGEARKADPEPAEDKSE